jgi:hypothetical protein
MKQLSQVIGIVVLAVSGIDGAEVLMPTIQGAWWQVAGDPDLGEFTDPKQQPVDFGIWQAAETARGRSGRASATPNAAARRGCSTVGKARS